MPENNVPLLSEADRAEVLRMFTDMKTKYGEIDIAIKAGKPLGELKTAIDKIDTDLAAIQSKYTLLDKYAKDLDEQIVQLKKGGAPAERKSIGDLVVEDAGLLAAIKSGGRFAVSVTLKGPLVNLLQAKDIINVSPGWPQQLPIVTSTPRPPIGVRTLVPQGRTSAGAVEYVEETSFTNLAAPVAEGAAKPKSDKVFTVRTSVVRTIAHYFKISRQSLEDLPFLASQIENNGIWGVQTVEDNQLLNGSGAPPNLQGFMTVATAAPAPTPATGATLVDAVGTAVFDLAAKGFIADGTVLNPADWGKVAMLKNSQGNYLFASPIDYTSSGRLWGTRLAMSSHQVATNFLVGAFQGNSQILDRVDVNVQIATQNEDDFIKNMATILAEERLALVIYQPLAFEKGVTPAGVI